MSAKRQDRGTLLSARNISKRFGGLEALSAVTLELQHGEIYGLIGPNGAGKTTFFNLLTGFEDGYEGEFRFHGEPLPAGNPQRIVARGVARTFQHIRLFPELSVLENLYIGQHLQRRSGLWDALTWNRRTRRCERDSHAHALDLLDFVGIPQHAAAAARTLSYGDQRRVEIARALASAPLLLALDEPTAGMNQTEAAQLRELLERIRARGVAILLIEHNVGLVMEVCDRVAVLDCGRLIAADRPAQVQRNEAVINAYLGRPRHVV